jgi:hypothetical protein
LLLTTYTVPDGFPLKLVTGNFNVDGAHNPVVPPGLAKPTEGLPPLNTVYDLVFSHLFFPIVLTFNEKYPFEVYVCEIFEALKLVTESVFPSPQIKKCVESVLAVDDESSISKSKFPELQ